ncbi:TPA: hypothetical protein N3A08_003545 [Salmonella enterica subsp. salamae serovar 9,46:z4,z24:z39:z42]|nr:hypothetical protein [Salmonella enterica subsp. salamae serovar 9,46:z4,z24:z39:z42]
MKLSVRDIRFSESGYASATAEVCGETSIIPVCEMDVSVSLVEGKSLERYKDELLAKAHERIAEMYKEIVCAGNDVGESKAFKVEHGKIIINAAQADFISLPYKGGLTLNAEGYLTATPIKL